MNDYPFMEVHFHKFERNAFYYTAKTEEEAIVLVRASFYPESIYHAVMEPTVLLRDLVTQASQTRVWVNNNELPYEEVKSWAQVN